MVEGEQGVGLASSEGCLNLGDGRSLAAAHSADDIPDHLGQVLGEVGLGEEAHRIEILVAGRTGEDSPEGSREE